MKQYLGVRSAVRPDERKIDDYSVWVAENIAEVSEPGINEHDPGFSGYQYDLTQYGKDEYIRMMDSELETTQAAVDFLLMQ